MEYLLQIKEKAREKLRGCCEVCPICNGAVCAGRVPGMGGVGTGASFRANLASLSAYRLNMKTIHNVNNPDTRLRLFNLELQTPVLAAPISGTHNNLGGAVAERELTGAMISGSRQAGSLGFTGDGEDPEVYFSGVDAILTEEGWGIPVIKPRPFATIVERIRRAEAVGSPAVGVDIDGAGLISMKRRGHPVGPKSQEELRRLVVSTSIPFIIKGIMTSEEAMIAAEIGAAAVVVSNHGGRVLDHTPGVADVLPGIVKAVGDRITVLADGGVRSGVDVLKLLALGAKAVLVGRPLATAAVGGGAEGVRYLLEKITGELKQAMLLTGCGSLKDIDDRVLFMKERW